MPPKAGSSSKPKRARVVRDPRGALLVPAKTQLARIPSPARFILVVLASLVGSSVLFTLTASWTVGDLGLVSKHLEEWWEVGGLMAWRAVEVGLAWILGYDSECWISLT